MATINEQEAEAMAATRMALDAMDAIGMIERACEGGEDSA